MTGQREGIGDVLPFFVPIRPLVPTPNQCRYRNDEGWRCPLDALENEEYYRLHLPR